MRRTKSGLKCTDCEETTPFNKAGFEFWLIVVCMEPDPLSPLSEASPLTAEPKAKVVDFAQAIQVRAQAILKANLQLRRSTKKLFVLTVVPILVSANNQTNL